MPLIREFTPENIEKVRDTLDLTQKAFAIKLGVGHATVPRWEKGAFKPSRHLLPKLVEAAEEAGFEVRLA